MRLLGLDRAANQADDLVRAGHYRNVYEATLDLGPLRLNATVRPTYVLLKRLMQYTNDDKAALAATSRFGQLLQQIDILARCSGSFQELAHLIKDDEHATNIRVFCTLDEFADDITNAVSHALGTAKWCVLINGLTQSSLKRLASTHQRDYSPRLAATECPGDFAGRIQTKRRLGTLTYLRRTSCQLRQRQCKGRLATAVWPGPSESPLLGSRYVAGSSLKSELAATMQNIAIKSILSGKIGLQLH
ncbi:hypothetical protein EIELFIGP_03646 [Stenotrophomonas maltophilia]|nr:hypothetical protein [Stenotrophomonas maltophilia]PZP80795.1 MAG: hypothetical protein DI592_11810 [Stenotrophomonas maltophilia]QNG74799.1 hypothetical protein EIELFIGP_03646 [Stenotrophomonas maltophilia]